jgi:hypothetical protein
MEILRPKSTGLDGSDRIYAAYPGIEYNICAAVHGGVPPFKYELTTNVPSGMEIDINTGEITWPSPSAATYTDIGLKVTDSVGTEVTSTWTVTCATTRFRFFDAVNGNNSWDGTSPTFVSGTTGPKQTMSAFWGIGSSTIIGYFLDGTYTNAGMTVSAEGIRWTVNGNRPSIWLAYPGHSPLIDFEFVDGVSETYNTGWDFGDGGSTPRWYMDGLEFTRAGNKCLRSFSCDNICIRRTYFHDWGPGADGSNSSCINFESGGFASGTWDNCVIQDCEFSDITQPAGAPEPNCAIKMYATSQMLIERCVFHDMTIGGEDEEAIGNKSGTDATIVRFCSSYNMDMGTYGGNQNNQATGDADAEICFNNFSADSGECIRINHDSTAFSPGPTVVMRNTLRGTVIFNQLQSDDGPYTFTHNVVINGNAATDNPNGSGITFAAGPTDISRLTVSEHLFGAAADNIVDANGLLQGSYRTQYLYYRGHEAPTL